MVNKNGTYGKNLYEINISTLNESKLKKNKKIFRRHERTQKAIQESQDICLQHCIYLTKGNPPILHIFLFDELWTKPNVKVNFFLQVQSM